MAFVRIERPIIGALHVLCLTIRSSKDEGWETRRPACIVAGTGPRQRLTAPATGPNGSSNIVVLPLSSLLAMQMPVTFPGVHVQTSLSGDCNSGADNAAARANVPAERQHAWRWERA